MNEIILDFSRLQGDVPELKDEQMLQVSAWKKTKKLLVQAVERVVENSENDSIFYNRSHDAILIDGSRGTGKSTFVRYIIESIQKGVWNELSDKPLLNIYPLQVIDPTLISTKENVIINLISIIREAVNKERNINSGSNEYKNWKNLLSRLAGGLCQVDGVGTNQLQQEDWNNKDYILEVGLDKANKGINLERDLNSFVTSSLKLLGKTCFLVTFDDSDTKFDQGWLVLECIRKYLTSPRIIVLISGDITLFSTLTRSEISKYFSTLKKNKENDLLTKESINNQISTLEEQYLLKTIKPENRVSINSLWSELSSGRSDIFYQYSKDKKIEVNEVFERFCISHLRMEGKDNIRSVKKSILKLPLRSNISIAKNFDLLPISNSNDEYSYLKESVTESIIQNFSTSLNSINVNIEYLKSPEEHPVKVLREKWKVIRSGKFSVEDYSIFDSDYLEPVCLAFFLSQYSVTNFSNLARVIALDSYLKSIFQLNGEMEKISDLCFSILNSNSSIQDIFWKITACVMFGISPTVSKNKSLIRIPVDNYKTVYALGRIFGISEQDTKDGYMKRLLELDDVTFNKKVDGLKNPYKISIGNWVNINKGIRKSSIKSINNQFWKRYSDLKLLDENAITRYIDLSIFTLFSKQASEKNNYLCLPILFSSIIEVLEIECSNLEQFAKSFLRVCEKKRWMINPLEDKSPPKKNDSLMADNDEDYDADIEEVNSDAESPVTLSLRQAYFIKCLLAWKENAKEIAKNVTCEDLNYLFNRYMFRVDDLNSSKLTPAYTGYRFFINIVNMLNDAFIFSFEKEKGSGVGILSYKTNVNTPVEFSKNLRNNSVVTNEKTMYRLLVSCPLIGMFLPFDSTTPTIEAKDSGVDFVFEQHIAALSSIVGTSHELSFDLAQYKKSLRVSISESQSISIFEALNIVPLVNEEKNTIKIFGNIPVANVEDNKQTDSAAKVLHDSSPPDDLISQAENKEGNMMSSSAKGEQDDSTDGEHQ